ncbi:hypothetical protein AWB82_03045 [Caballeronia glebae]|uniref:Uncharacterized protein n=1 Tax=Caballeronia glebae TaxID=1777143 RepID=A0A158AV76_9BURK|nr:hypothetical protein AWB82_03045 [Caballeronia glebae]
MQPSRVGRGLIGGAIRRRCPSLRERGNGRALSVFFQHDFTRREADHPATACSSGPDIFFIRDVQKLENTETL